MNAKDKISDYYRKQVDELLDNQSGPGLFVQLDQEELDEIWEEISTEIDIGEVWNNISSDLDLEMPVAPRYRLVLKSIAVVLFLLIGMVPVKKSLPDPGISKPDNLIDNKQYEQPAGLIIENKSLDLNPEENVKKDIITALRISSENDVDGNKVNQVERKNTDAAQEASITKGNETVPEVLAAYDMADSNLVISPDLNPVEKSIALPILFPDNLEKIKVHSRIDFERSKIMDISSGPGFSLPLTERGRISGGFIALLKNTWLLNQKTFDGLTPDSLISTQLVFFPDFGLSLVYSLNTNWMIQADGFLLSKTGQEYLDFIKGHYSRKTVTLRYSTVALSVKYKFTGGGRFGHRSSVNLLAGGYLSVLHHANQKILYYANQKINTDIENVGSQFRKFDIGVRLGSEIEIPLFADLSLAPGLFLSLGIPDISGINSIVPGTHNGSAEFHLTFYYHFD